MARHGRAVMPFGVHKGICVNLLPDAYLSFLTTIPFFNSPDWKWLRDSILSELRFRGFSTESLEREVFQEVDVESNQVESNQAEFDFAEAKFFSDAKRSIRVE